MPIPFDTCRALQDAPVGVMFVDGRNLIQWCNHTLVELLAVPLDEIRGRRIDELPVREPSLFSSVDFITPVHAPERRLRCEQQQLEDGLLIYWLDVTSCLQSVKARTLGIDGRDGTSVDGRLAIPGRQAILKRLANEVARSRRYQNPLSVLLLVGEQLSASENLRQQAAEVIRESMRWVDCLGHWGQGEFLLVLPETTLQDAESYRSKLIQRLQACGLELTASCAGWCSGDDALALVQKASPLPQALQA